MTWDEFDSWLRAAIAGAGSAQREALAADVVTRMTRQEVFGKVLDPASELDESGWAALARAREALFTASPDELRQRLQDVDAATLTEGNMDPYLLWAICAVTHWAEFRDGGEEEELRWLALTAIDEADFVEEGDIQDFLAKQLLRAEADRIADLLGGVRPGESA